MKIRILLYLISLTAFLPCFVRAEPFWVFFGDKGPDGLRRTRDRATVLSERSMQRRHDRAANGAELQPSDLLLYEPYIQRLVKEGVHIRNRSRWFNAVSIDAHEQDIERIAGLHFVSRVQPVRVMRRTPDRETFSLHKPVPAVVQHQLDYGQSLDQNALSTIPFLHDRSITGTGVLIGVFDTGFQLNHEALQHIPVVASYDFVDRDSVVGYEPDKDSRSQPSHGTKVLSIMGGYAPGSLIGPAFGASYVLAKTEDVRSETIVEEDNYIAALEWCDSLGVDIVSSSLGYMDWYETGDMDGNTAPITRAADLAVKKGMLVFTAAGNEGNGSWVFIIAPADGDSVVAVGAVNYLGTIAGFSSQGPTADGRIKPDVCAMGSGTVSVSSPSLDVFGSRYTTGSGTSFSTPLVAGIAAQLLSVFPQAAPMQVREALRQTASRADNPDNRYGYGIVDAVAALDYLADFQTGIEPERPFEITVRTLAVRLYPNPVDISRQNVMIRCETFAATRLRIRILNTMGQVVRTFIDRNLDAGREIDIVWNGTNDQGVRVSAGLYFCAIHTDSDYQLYKLTVGR